MREGSQARKRELGRRKRIRVGVEGLGVGEQGMSKAALWVPEEVRYGICPGEAPWPMDSEIRISPFHLLAFPSPRSQQPAEPLEEE